MKYHKRSVKVFSFLVRTRQQHIEEGKCRLVHKCMEKLAIEEALQQIFPHEHDSHRVRVDGGHISFNAAGYRHRADTPRIATASLIKFDQRKPVAPHQYTVTAYRTTRIQQHSSERQTEINKARRERVAAGSPDKRYERQTLHKRVVGFR